MFSCQQSIRVSNWIIHLQPGMTLIGSANSGQPERVTTFLNDPGYGFTIHVLPTSTTTSVHSELHVTAVRELHGVRVECEGLRTFNSTIQISSVGKLW